LQVLDATSIKNHLTHRHHCQSIISQAKRRKLTRFSALDPLAT
jgi:hypothetical protein